MGTPRYTTNADGWWFTSRDDGLSYEPSATDDDGWVVLFVEAEHKVLVHQDKEGTSDWVEGVIERWVPDHAWTASVLRMVANEILEEQGCKQRLPLGPMEQIGKVLGWKEKTT
jgi:hypothetical protein